MNCVDYKNRCHAIFRFKHDNLHLSFSDISSRFDVSVNTCRRMYKVGESIYLGNLPEVDSIALDTFCDEDIKQVQHALNILHDNNIFTLRRLSKLSYQDIIELKGLGRLGSLYVAVLYSHSYKQKSDVSTIKVRRLW